MPTKYTCGSTTRYNTRQTIERQAKIRHFYATDKQTKMLVSEHSAHQRLIVITASTTFIMAKPLDYILYHISKGPYSDLNGRLQKSKKLKIFANGPAG